MPFGAPQHGFRLTTMNARATLHGLRGLPRVTIVRLASAGFVATALLACAAVPPTPTNEAATEEVATVVPRRSDVTCTIRRPTGSKIAVKQCFTRTESERMSEASQEWIRSGGSHGSPYVVPDPADPRESEAAED
jgi:hypothetical protein